MQSIIDVFSFIAKPSQVKLLIEVTPFSTKYLAVVNRVSGLATGVIIISTLASQLKDWPDLLEKNVLSLPISGTGAGQRDFLLLLTFNNELNFSKI